MVEERVTETTKDVLVPVHKTQAMMVMNNPCPRCKKEVSFRFHVSDPFLHCPSCEAQILPAEFA